MSITMGRLSERNPCYRTRQQIADDIHFALHSQISFGGRHSIYKKAFWVWSEFEGKHQGCIWWSQAAIDSWTTEKKLKLLCHEHVVPMSALVHVLESLNDKSAKNIRNVLHKFCVGASILRTEHAHLNTLFRSKMPPGWGDLPLSQRDPFARYRHCSNIVLVCNNSNLPDALNRPRL